VRHKIEEIRIVGRFRAAEEFRGVFILMINEEEYEFRINPDQEFENNLYAILNFLDDYIVDKDYLMPILGVRKTLEQ
jgi:hypothetical protein